MAKIPVQSSLTMHTEHNTKPKPKLRWYHPTPGRLLVLLLAVEAVLLLSKWWFPKGWAVLFAVAAVGVFLLLMLLWFIVSLIFRWRFQFSIRSLLLLTFVVAIPCSWLAVEMKRAKKQKEAVEAIWKMSLEGSYDEKFEKSTSPHALVWLREQLGNDFFDNVFSVCFYGLPMSLSGVQEVSDSGLECLNGLTQLKTLYLWHTKVSDVGVEHLKGMTQLQILHLNNTKVSDIGVEYFKGMTQLQILSLSNTKVSDSGAEHLKGMTQLQELDLSNTGVTDAGVAELQKALPNCDIRH
jgi:hypothetical protein